MSVAVGCGAVAGVWLCLVWCVCGGIVVVLSVLRVSRGVDMSGVVVGVWVSGGVVGTWACLKWYQGCRCVFSGRRGVCACLFWCRDVGVSGAVVGLLVCPVGFCRVIVGVCWCVKCCV